eukprot:TRINITY_DN10942_c0_g1_i1.p1 TRINITY_DN10942_c0_g1~~TRINITY_DN10942_c0_g1_i1.p1  ORF type:complete len:480 (-),score=125.67 TRINITY_DN10942_c0_g1_i1:98-1537(-)
MSSSSSSSSSSSLARLRPVEDLARAVVRCFYEADHVVVVDALIRFKERVKDTDLATRLHLHHKSVRQVLHNLFEDQLVAKEVRNIPQEQLRMYQKGNTQNTYWYIDYKHLVNAIRLRLSLMQSQLSATRGRVAEQQLYRCPRCDKKFTALDVAAVMDSKGVGHCPNCRVEMVETAPASGEDDLSKSSKALQQLRPLVALLKSTESVVIPDDVATSYMDSVVASATGAGVDVKATEALAEKRSITAKEAARRKAHSMQGDVVKVVVSLEGRSIHALDAGPPQPIPVDVDAKQREDVEAQLDEEILAHVCPVPWMSRAAAEDYKQHKAAQARAVARSELNASRRNRMELEYTQYLKRFHHELKEQLVFVENDENRGDDEVPMVMAVVQAAPSSPSIALPSLMNIVSNEPVKDNALRRVSIKTEAINSGVGSGVPVMAGGRVIPLSNLSEQDLIAMSVDEYKEYYDTLQRLSSQHFHDSSFL